MQDKRIEYIKGTLILTPWRHDTATMVQSKHQPLYQSWQGLFAEPLHERLIEYVANDSAQETGKEQHRPELQAKHAVLTLFYKSFF